VLVLGCIDPDFRDLVSTNLGGEGIEKKGQKKVEKL